MGCRNGEGDLLGEVPSAASTIDALLLATVCAVGLPVEVQVKDGSLYTGLFHTASVDDGYGIVLKKARMMKKGRWSSNLGSGAVVDTLVVLSCDLVQLIVKDFVLPTEGITAYSVGDSMREGIDSVDSHWIDASSCNVTGNSEVHELHHVESFTTSNNKHTDLRTPNEIYGEEVQEHSLKMTSPVQEGQVERKAHEQENSCSQIDDEASTTNTVIYEAHQFSPSLNSVDENHADFTSKRVTSGERCRNPVFSSNRQEGFERTNNILRDVLSNDQISTNLTSSSSVASISSSTTTNHSALPNLPASHCSTFTKEFKLNPEAKVFRPSCASARSTLAVIPTAVNTSYASSIPPEVPVAATPSSLEFSSLSNCTPLSAKFVQYSPLVAGQSGVITEYPRPVMGPANARQQLVRVSRPYHPVQSGAAYIHQNSQPVLVGRTGQVVYMHSLPQDPIAGTTVLSQSFPLLRPFQANIPKLQGTPAQSMQFCIPQPLISRGSVQPFVMPSPVQLSPPVPPVRAIAVPGGNGFFGSKFQ
ncbi:hypothetical protein AXF42_Ash017007 [Apostasia shenzhenica]|uniref:Ataxin 2 SM domain-containing protein n=1 Tax=Apostasia shenzhenica TaxID=1088818 RepID=A0A2I0B7E6_9ASPA|nr:hypothetical protein AXF42_Ash017007 [Apostasia shenzhenica]